MTENKPKPIYLRTAGIYECPICHWQIEGKDKAEEHVAMPVSSGLVLPRGFVWKDKHGLTSVNAIIGYEGSWLSKSHVRWFPPSNHDCRYYTQGYGLYEDRDLLRENNFHESCDLKDRFESGKASLLTSKEFDEAKKIFDENDWGRGYYGHLNLKGSELIRTFDGIEKWIKK